MANPTYEIRSNNARDPKVAAVDMKLEAIVIPVSDVDRAEEFYRRLGWRQDVTPPGSGVFQFTPHGSACSVQFGKTLTSAAPGSAQRTYLIVSNIEAARDVLIEAGIEVSEIFPQVGDLGRPHLPARVVMASHGCSQRGMTAQVTR